MDTRFKRRKKELGFGMIKKKQNFKQKIQELKNAAKDNRFLDDLNEISEDFKIADLDEILNENET